VCDAKESSKAQYASNLRSIETMLGKSLITASQRDVIELAKALRKMKSGAQYAKIAGMFYRKAKRPELVELLRLKQRVTRLRPEDLLSPSEIQSMIDASPSMRDKALVACLWECGVRVSELLAVNLADVRERPSPENGGRKVYVLWFGTVKERGAEHEGFVIESAPLLEKWLKAYPFQKRADLPLFPSFSGARMHRRAALDIVKKLGRRAGLQKRVHPHLFRHSRATWSLATGMSESQVKVLLGWTSGSTMLSRYSHLTSRDAYKGLLGALGMQPEHVDVQKLSFEDDDLKPVVPLTMPKGTKKRDAAVDAEVNQLRGIAAKMQESMRIMEARLLEVKPDDVRNAEILREMAKDPAIASALEKVREAWKPATK
jgi:integrase